MSRFDKLKRLKDEISRLFDEGLDKNAIFNQLRADEQFADASYEEVQAFYSNLQEKRDVEAENERQIAEKDQQIAFCQQILKISQQIAKSEQQIERDERELAKKQQMKIEMESMIKYKQNSNKFWIYDESFVNQVFCKNFWQERFLVTEENTNATDHIYTIKIQDLFQDTTKAFKVQNHSRFLMLYYVTFPFVLLHEFGTPNLVEYLRLAKLDFVSESLQVIQSIEFNGNYQVLVNASDVSKFLLRRENDVNECNIIGDQIQVGRRISLEPNFNIPRGSYFDKQICSLRFEVTSHNQFRNRQLTQVKMLLYNLERNEHSTQDVDSTPENIVCFYPNLPNYSAWVRNTVFVTVQFRLAEKFGIIFTSPQLRNWKFVEFATNLRINCIKAFANGTLMICSEEERQSKKEIYKLQMRKPDFLRNMAWVTMVKLLKEAKINNPYEKARQYLPLNSELQPFIFVED